MKTVAIIFCEDNFYLGGQKTLNSLKYFHPEFKIVKYGTKEIKELKEKYNCSDIRFIAPLAMKDTWETENPDLLIKFGGDLLVLGVLDEVINLDYDVAAGRNDPDSVTGDERNNRPDLIRDLPNNEWVNADFICVKNKKFLDDYVKLMLDWWEGRGAALKDFGRFYRGDCQSGLNIIFRLGGYKSLILDKFGNGLIYNASGNETGGIENDKEMTPSSNGNGCNNWRAWKYIFFNGSKCIMPDFSGKIGDRIVKVLHQGGGTWEPKLSWDLFNIEFRKYLEKVTNFLE
jgi:hypothetical protein